MAEAWKGESAKSGSLNVAAAAVGVSGASIAKIVFHLFNIGIKSFADVFFSVKKHFSQQLFV